MATETCPWTCSNGFPWEPVRKAELQAPPQVYRTRLYFNKIPSDFTCTLMFEKWRFNPQRPAQPHPVQTGRNKSCCLAYQQEDQTLRMIGSKEPWNRALTNEAYLEQIKMNTIKGGIGQELLFLHPAFATVLITTHLLKNAFSWIKNGPEYWADNFGFLFWVTYRISQENHWILICPRKMSSILFPHMLCLGGSLNSNALYFLSFTSKTTLWGRRRGSIG